MSAGSLVRSQPFETFLERQRQRDVLRFIACGSVDDGKSTLIGRLLHDTKQVLDDQVIALERASRRFGATGGAVDFALLVDGLTAEREQGITIDVAYRFFATERRSFVVADTPGHEEYTRNMATGASSADAAVLLVDARQGLTRQTRRHALLVAMLGIRHVVLAVNKMDLVGWSAEVFDRVDASFRAFSEKLGFREVVSIPLSALNGDNVAMPGVSTPWYEGPTLLRHLEQIEAAHSLTDKPFRLPVQWVNRPNGQFRGYAGLIASGSVAVGDPIVVQPSGSRSSVERIVGPDGDLERAQAGQSVTLVLSDAVDVSRGDCIAASSAPPAVAERLAARLFVTGAEPLGLGRTLLIRVGTASAVARIASIEGRVDPNDLAMGPADTLAPNDIGDVVLSLDRPLAFDPYDANRETGGLILVDRETANTLALGLLSPLPSASA